jgi:diguanylate cyclase (GGDEF)-like protein
MPGADGVEVCRQVREMAQPVAPYIILLTANNRKDHIVAGLGAGANDYIRKPFDPAEVHARLDVGIREVESQNRLATRVRSLVRAESELRNLSLTDDLTGLWNRRGFLLHAEQHLRTCTRTGETSLLLYADMDGLKQINDTFGHREGSLAITRVASILMRTFRESDIVARLSGDEFAVLITKVMGDDLEAIEKRMDENMSSHNAENALAYKLEVSIGMVVIDPAMPKGVEELIAQADQLMYRQKAAKKVQPSL